VRSAARSIGDTRIGPLDDTAGAFGRADAALHHAKQTGRNQVLAWDALVASGHLAPKQSDAVLELFRAARRPRRRRRFRVKLGRPQVRRRS
jgi:predicted signal transduction protein with EAL and GGDEF domain